eukprot:12426655-Ditylum_brightwellii.AAC.1
MGTENGIVKTLVALPQSKPNSTRKWRDKKGFTRIYCPVGRKCCDYYCHLDHAHLPLIFHCINEQESGENVPWIKWDLCLKTLLNKDVVKL